MKRNVFISKPSTLNPEQAKFWKQMHDLLANRNLVPHTLGESDFSNTAPMNAVVNLMRQCQGVIIIGFRQTFVETGVSKGGSAKEQSIANFFLPTPWNQIEAGMAFALKLPTLILCEKDVRGGVFEIGNTDRFVHQTTIVQSWLDSPQFLGPFSEWHDEIVHRSLDQDA
jgi:hypothetical protein